MTDNQDPNNEPCRKCGDKANYYPLARMRVHADSAISKADEGCTRPAKAEPFCKCLEGTGVYEIDCEVHGLDTEPGDGQRISENGPVTSVRPGEQKLVPSDGPVPCPGCRETLTSPGPHAWGRIPSGAYVHRRLARDGRVLTEENCRGKPSEELGPLTEEEIDSWEELTGVEGDYPGVAYPSEVRRLLVTIRALQVKSQEWELGYNLANGSRGKEQKRAKAAEAQLGVVVEDVAAAVNDLSAIWGYLNGDDPHWGHATELVLTVKNYLTDTIANLPATESEVLVDEKEDK